MTGHFITKNLILAVMLDMTYIKKEIILEQTLQTVIVQFCVVL